MPYPGRHARRSRIHTNLDGSRRETVDERCASSLADDAGDDGGMKCIMNLCATIIATISAIPDETAT